MIFQGALSETPPAGALTAHFPCHEGAVAPYQGACSGWHAAPDGQHHTGTEPVRTDKNPPEHTPPHRPGKNETAAQPHCRNVCWGIAYYYCRSRNGYRLHVPFDGHTPIF
ncbi:hypothetical protein [Conchiformibius kuhniae]|uniref:Uncharacterized protein n=1 Tax=Conchiformibius kuhniae TaxID=211502 RepID=A0A8T9MW56_9NEIS|nr:hypothetical protein [Conchiformibius kuhniae]UOP04133.1 hypothetical protein LVJ77_06620 [Conchiformibius kuhniae]